MNILIVTEDLVVGGAQIFALRLAQALSKNNNVHLFCYLENLIINDIVRTIAPDIKLLTYRPPGAGILRLIARILYKFKIDLSFYNMCINREIKRYFHELNIDIVHSHAFKVDYELSKIFRSLEIPWVITSHGDHAIFHRNIVTKSGEQILNYYNKLKRVLVSVNHFVYLSKRQLNFFRATELIGYKKYNKKMVNIYNGYTGEFSRFRREVREKLNISDECMVFGMVARDNPDKGWRECIEAFKKIEISYNVALILVGEGKYLHQLKREYSYVKRLYFTGFSSNSIDWIQGFDIGVLPTRDDNLPTSIIEYLYCEKPVIATDIGEISDMISSADGVKAGFTLKLNSSGRVDTDNLAECMKAYLDDDMLYNKHKVLTKKAILKFDMKKCVSNYKKLYKESFQSKN